MAKIEYWPQRRRASKLLPGDIIECDSGYWLRNHIKTVEPCERDGRQQVKVTFADGHVRYIDADDDEDVYRPGSI